MFNQYDTISQQRREDVPGPYPTLYVAVLTAQREFNMTMQPMNVGDPDAVSVGSAERNLRLAMKLIGAGNLTFVAFIYGDRFLFDSKAGYAWSPDHYDEHGNTTLEFEWMIIFTYFGLGVCLILAALDPVLDNAKWLINFCIFGGFGAHAVSMLVAAIWDYENEWGHLMPYGDVPLLFAFSTILFVLKRKYELKQS